LASIVLFLASDTALPKKYRDHALIGNWRSCRDCHVFYDLVLIYQYVGVDRLRLVRLGSHAELNLG